MIAFNLCSGRARQLDALSQPDIEQGTRCDLMERRRILAAHELIVKFNLPVNDIKPDQWTQIAKRAALFNT